MKFIKEGLIFIFSIILFLCCDVVNHDLEQAKKTIVAETFAAAVATLSSDEFEGRLPSSPGEDKTIAFLKEKFSALGLQPGNGNSFFQEVPLVGITSSEDLKMKVSGANFSKTLAFQKEFMAWTKRVIGVSSLNSSEIVFVGYGAIAPEYAWNDYQDVDVKGKTVVILVNDPGYATQDSTLFNGNAMTYYGRWTYKFEEAARQGAAGAFIVHENEAAGYPWEVVSGSWSGKQFDLVNADNNMSRCAIEGWLSWETATQLFQGAGLDLATLKESAKSVDFKAVSSGLKSTVKVNNNVEQLRSQNVVAMIPGAVRPDEVVIYAAHWDHFGKVAGMAGDNIYNGAFDNATGTAALLEIAKAFMTLKTKPERTIIFLAVTAEEQGLLGSRYYATNPVFPSNKTVAAINMDGMNVLGKMRDITVVGYGNSELEGYLEKAARRQGRTLRPDPEPQKGYFYRSDHFNFAKVGIPALYTDNGIEHVEHGADWTLQQLANYTAENYHKPSDEYNPDWDLTGAIDDMRLLFEVGYNLANAAVFPDWFEGNEFKAIRDADRNSTSSAQK